MMDENYLPLLCGVGLVVSVVPLSILFYWLNKRGWMTMRLLALLTFLLISSIGVLCWFYLSDKVLLFAMVGLGALAGLSVLSWRFTSPKLVKLLNLKW